MSAGPRPSPLALARGAGAVALVVALVLLLRRAAFIDASDALFALGFLVVAGSVGGSVAAFFGLPRLTGYIIAGLIAGPQGTGLLEPHDVKALTLINALALALIALQAGAELTVATVRRIVGSVLSSAVFQLLLVVPAVAGAFYVATQLDAVPFVRGLSATAIVAIALLMGTIGFTRSPAVTVAVLSETQAKGPLTDWSLGIVVLLDVMILPVFATALAYVRTELSGDAFSLAMLNRIGHELFVSFAAGVTFGLVLGLLLRLIEGGPERILSVIVTGFSVTAVCAYLRYDTLFVFVVAGFTVTNLVRRGDVLVASSERTSAAVMVVFFATAGAKLNLRALASLWPVVLALFSVRIISSYVSAKLGHVVARDEPAVRKNGWLVLVSQAGVTIGLATVASDALPGIGPKLASLVIAGVALNELLGAALLKLALSRAGEIGGATRAAPAAA